MTSSRRRWGLPAATITLALLSAGALAAAALASASIPEQASTSTPAPRASAVQATPSATAEPTHEARAASIAELADPTWVRRIAASASIPERALTAYAGASLSVARSHPECGLGWNTLAAIGHVESEHGTIGGAQIGADGIAAPAIVGVALDGNGTLVVPDTDGGVLDGDASWDRAVGPMQFIPDTWAAYGRDGNGDGEVDVHQIDDAALAAAEYLCDACGDLTDPAGWISAIDAYNPSVEYNNRVAEAAGHYASIQ